MNEYRNCPDCITYAERRMSVLTPAMAARSNETGETGMQILDRYMTGVHERHLAGLPIVPGQVQTLPPRITGGKIAALMAIVHEAAQ